MRNVSCTYFVHKVLYGTLYSLFYLRKTKCHVELCIQSVCKEHFSYQIDAEQKKNKKKLDEFNVEQSPTDQSIEFGKCHVELCIQSVCKKHFSYYQQTPYSKRTPTSSQA
jgi:hypothetical protein